MVVPDRFHARVFAAGDVGGQRVADHHAFLGGNAGERSAAGVEKRLLGLAVTERLRNEHVVKVGEKTRHREAVELLVVEGVARRAENVLSLEIAADLVRAVDGDGGLVEKSQKTLLKHCAVGLDAEGLEDVVPAKLKKLLRGEFAALDLLPEHIVDAREDGIGGIVEGKAALGKADAHGLLGAFAEVEQGIVNVHEDCFEHGRTSYSGKKRSPSLRSGIIVVQLLSGVNRSLLTILAETLETEHAALLGVEGIVRADTDIHARMDVGAALAHKNVAGENKLTVSALGTKTLGVRVAAVLRGAAALLVGEKLKTDVQHGDLPSFL